MSNPFFRETLDETGNRYEEEIPRDNRSRVIPAGKVAQTFPMQVGGVLENAPLAGVGPTSPPQVGPVVDDTPMTDEEIDKQIAELEAQLNITPDKKGKVEVGPSPDDIGWHEPAFVDTLKSVENSIKAGYNEETGLWKPHESLEGGRDTIGYGHKLTAAEAKSGKIKIGDRSVSYKVGLSDEDVELLMEQDMNKAEKRLSSIKGYKDFPQKYKDVLTNISFNVGRVTEKGWPKLFKAMRAEDDEAVRKEMVTSYKDKQGNRQQLTERATAIADAVGLSV